MSDTIWRKPTGGHAGPGGLLSPSSPVVRQIGDFALARSIGLLLLAQMLTNLPTSATGIFLPTMAADLGTDVAVVGGLRGLGGGVALVCGVLAAPLIDRMARAWAVSGALVLLAVGALLAAFGGLGSLALFFAIAGAAGAVQQPTLQSAAADGRDGPTGARAAAMLSAGGGLSPMLAGPLLAAPALYWGWRGDFVAIALCCLGVAAAAGATLARYPAAGVARPSYLTAFRLVADSPGAVPLLLGSTLRGILQFAWLTYLAAYLVLRFDATTSAVALTWTLGGLSFFLSSLAMSRLFGRAETGGWRSPRRLLPVALAVMTLLTPIGFLVPTLELAVPLAGLTAGAHGAVIAATISLIVSRHAHIRGAALGLNAAGSNLGLFLGAAIGGTALAWGGYPGLTLVLTLLASASGAVYMLALRTRPAHDDPVRTASRHR